MRRNQLSLHMRVLWNKLKFINNQTHYENTIATLSSHQQYYVCYAMLCYAKSLQSCPTLCDPIDGSYQAPPSLGFSRQEHWSGLPFPPPGDLLDPRIEPLSLVSPASAGEFFTTEPPGKPVYICVYIYFVYQFYLSGEL